MQNSGNWQDLRPRDRMEYLLKTGHLSDCSFVVYDDDGQKVVLKCHKFVLMNVSPVFERMFEGDFEESKTPDNIVLDDVSGPDFKKFIEYLYWHDNRILDLYDLRLLQTLIYLSKKFMVSVMTSNCLNVIKRRLGNGLDADVTVDLFEYAYQIDDADLIKSVISKFRSNSEIYVNTPAVFDLSSEIFLRFIEQFESYISDKIRFDVIERYCRIHGLSISAEQPESGILNTLIYDKNDDLLQTANRFRASLSSDSKKDDKSNAVKKTEETSTQVDENENNVVKDKHESASTDQMDKANIEQTERYQREEQKKKDFVEKLLKTIKFTSMTSYDFCSGPGVSNLLTIEKKYEVLSAICISEYKMRLLASFQA